MTAPAPWEGKPSVTEAGLLSPRRGRFRVVGYRYGEDRRAYLGNWVDGDFETRGEAEARAEVLATPSLQMVVYDFNGRVCLNTGGPPPAVDRSRPISVTKLAGLSEPKRSRKDYRS